MISLKSIALSAALFVFVVAANAKTNRSPIGIKWTLASLEDTVLAGVEPKTFIVLEKSGRITGFAYCNNIAGSFKINLQKKTLSFSRFQSTWLVCDGLKNEQYLLKLLQRTTRYAFDGNTWILYSAKQKLISFRRGES